MKKCWCGNENLQEYNESYYKCAQCGTLVSKSDFPDAIYKVSDETEDLYGENYWKVKMAKAAGKNTISEIVDMYLSERVIYWLKYILKYVKLGGTVAEIGCGLGQLQYVLKRIDYQQTAFELSENICRFIKEKLEVNVCCGDFIQENTAVYNGILAFDLFEHLNNPEEFLCKCSESIQDNGVLVFQTPCYDPKLDYMEMLQLKPRFQKLLTPEQHIFLFSRESMTNILKKYGFTNIIFEPAFFGDDYDMFFIASKSSIVPNLDSDIEAYLNSVKNGRLIKAMIKLFDDKNEKQRECDAIEKERCKILQDVNLLTDMIKEKEEELSESSKAAEERLAAIERLTRENEILEQAAEERLAVIERLTKENKISEQAAEERLEAIEKLTKENKILEQAAEERLEVIEKLTENLETDGDE